MLSHERFAEHPVFNQKIARWPEHTSFGGRAVIDGNTRHVRLAPIPVIARQNCYTRKPPSPGPCASLIVSKRTNTLLMPLLMMIIMVAMVTVAMIMVVMRQVPDWVWNPG
jgi:hypothetical protein